MGQRLKNVRIYISVSHIGDDEIVPVGETGKFRTKGAKVYFGAYFVNFKTEVLMRIINNIYGFWQNQ